MSSMFISENPEDFVPGVDVGCAHEKLKIPKYKKGNDLKHLRDVVKFYKKFPGQIQDCNSGVVIEIVPLEYAWHCVVKRAALTGTCGAHARYSYYWIFYIYKCYCQTKEDYALQLWLQRELESLDISAFSAEIMPGDYKDLFAQWFVEAVNSCTDEAKGQLQVTLWPRSDLHPETAQEMYGNVQAMGEGEGLDIDMDMETDTMDTTDMDVNMEEGPIDGDSDTSWSDSNREEDSDPSQATPVTTVQPTTSTAAARITEADIDQLLSDIFGEVSVEAMMDAFSRVNLEVVDAQEAEFLRLR